MKNVLSGKKYNRGVSLGLSLSRWQASIKITPNCLLKSCYITQADDIFLSAVDHRTRCKSFPQPGNFWDVGYFTYELLNLLKVWYGECVHTPPVRPKILSRSGGARISLPITEDLNPGAYCSTQSNTIRNKETNKQMQVCPRRTPFHVDLRQYINRFKDLV